MSRTTKAADTKVVSRCSMRRRPFGASFFVHHRWAARGRTRLAPGIKIQFDFHPVRVPMSAMRYLNLAVICLTLAGRPLAPAQTNTNGITIPMKKAGRRIRSATERICSVSSPAQLLM